MYSSLNTKQCTLLLLVGMKGVGKTFIGSVLERYLNIKFLRIEPIFLELLQLEPKLEGVALEKRGFQIVITKLDELAQQYPVLCIESTGTALTFPELLAALHQGFCVLLINIQAPIDSCIQRVRTRDASVHIPVSEDRLREINERALLVDLPWDLKINNSEFQDETDIAQAVQELLQNQ
jgi:shikimate kinase